MITLYGLKNCDTCKKAMKELEAAGIAFEFVDIRADADVMAHVPVWLKKVGGKVLINTRSTTWRGLGSEDRNRAETQPAALLIENPTLIKRPVIVAGSDVHVGWTPAVRQALLGASA